ncbi:hypothetical protein PJWF_00065 [Achromobacter phage JWF]|uniref:hypothetical protein n=1 Tax=Achromobacter phage JWF TaxID=1589748 RepID=UPI000588E288|nr:hypothetical protein AXJ13_gp065 [Achromobacter phage JWF]AJD82959.1 hypothetical protein PJWF_00065 [Achromobacter phage JWF]
MTEKIITDVSHYGVHWSEEGVAYLHQGRGATNFLSMKAPSPFNVRPVTRFPCNHLFPVSAQVPDPRHWEAFRRLAADPLVRAMLPLPKPAYTPGVYFIEDAANELLRPLYTLSRLSSPLEPIVRPVWTAPSLSQLVTELGRTNVQPLVMTQLTYKHSGLLEELKTLSYNSRRNIILTGSSLLVINEPVEKIQTTLTVEDFDLLHQMPLENLGMMVLKRHMRRDDDPLGPLPPKR